jgi:hypothetical protein
MQFQILVNHVGYDVSGSKQFVVQSREPVPLDTFQVLDAEGGVVLEGDLVSCGAVEDWKGRWFHSGDFSALSTAGSYRIVVQGVASESFVIRAGLLPKTCLSDLIYYFKIQRCSGEYDKADRSLGFFGEPDRPRVDVHGGWYDASGDVSKYLSHQSEANYMNPQQSPLVVWVFLETMELLQTGQNAGLKSMLPMLTEEALYGADFLMRMQDPSGYFYASVMDACTGDPAQREICGYKGLGHTKHGETEAAFREGGGMTIAALARLSTLQQSGDYSPDAYLAAAEKGFEHLQVHNLEYVDDHRENILDDYCALFAATELYMATQKDGYLDAARQRAESLVRRIASDEQYSGWWRADEEGDRPFFHATDAGLPVVALLRYLQAEPDTERRATVEEAVTTSLRFELSLTDEVVNPFGYARQYVRDLGADRRAAFFFPHENETGYWWVGENARLGSLAAAALLGRRVAPAGMTEALRTYATNQVNWILGLNPYDMCMLQGKGRNNPADYEVGLPSPPGGICNGITSGVEDELDIAFLPEPHGTDAHWTWRWKEQWIPHAAWLILALAAEAEAEVKGDGD